MYKNNHTYTGDKNSSSKNDNRFYNLQNIKHLASVHNNNFVYNPNIKEDDYAGFYNYDKIYKFDDIILQQRGCLVTKLLIFCCKRLFYRTVEAFFDNSTVSRVPNSGLEFCRELW
jgi:hypothetical protein